MRREGAPAARWARAERRLDLIDAELQDDDENQQKGTQ